MNKKNKYKVMAIATFCKNFDIEADNEEAAKRIAKTILNEDGGDPFEEKDMISETYVAGLVKEEKEEKTEAPELTDEEFERFDQLQDAFYDFCLMYDDNEEMADDMDECFEQEIEPFDPYKLFHWKKLFNTEIKKGKTETVFSGGEKLHKKVTLIDVFEMDDFDADGHCSSGSGVELWMTDDFDFFTTRYAEVVERDDNGNQVTAMRYRQMAEKDFYDFVGEFHSEDFFEVFKDKIEESKKRSN